MELLDPLLLRAVDAFASRRGTGPTVRELAADLGIPDDFGHDNLVQRLQAELARENVALYRGRFTLTAVGRLSLTAAEAGPRAEPAAPTQAP